MGDRAAYLREIEAHFVALRGQGMMLSATDVERVETWRRENVPLNVVKRVLQEGMSAYAHEHPHERLPRSLSYFDKAVRESMRERSARLIDATRAQSVSTSAAPSDRPGPLVALLARLDRAQGAMPDGGPVAAALDAARRRLTEAPLGSDSWALTADVDAAMVKTLADGLSPAERDRIEADAHAAVDAHGGAVMSEQARRDRYTIEWAHRVRSHFGAPDLMEMLLARGV